MGVNWGIGHARPLIALETSRLRDLMAAKLGGYHAELRLIGEVSVASQSDTERVTAMALSYCTSWMDGTVILPSSPWGYGTIPNSVLDAQVVEVNRVVHDANERSRGLVEAHEAQILELAKVIYAQRRLSDGALDAALRACGFEPAKPSSDDE